VKSFAWTTSDRSVHLTVWSLRFNRPVNAYVEWSQADAEIWWLDHPIETASADDTEVDDPRSMPAQCLNRVEWPTRAPTDRCEGMGDVESSGMGPDFRSVGSRLRLCWVNRRGANH